MKGRILRIESKRRLCDKDSDKKVHKNIDSSDNSPVELINDDESLVDVYTTSYQLYCCPTQNASYAMYYPLPYTQMSNQDMPLFQAPWRNMSYVRTYPVTHCTHTTGSYWPILLFIPVPRWSSDWETYWAIHGSSGHPHVYGHLRQHPVKYCPVWQQYRVLHSHRESSEWFPISRHAAVPEFTWKTRNKVMEGSKKQ